MQISAEQPQVGPKHFRRTFTLALALAVVSTSSAQQTTPQLSPHALAVKEQADRLKPKSKVSVVPLHGEEEFGNFVANDATTVTFYDIDRKISVTLPYETLKKIKKGHGGYNYLAHKHVDREKNLIVATAIVAGLVVLLGIAAASR